MTLTLDLAPELESYLREEAARQGQEVSEYVTRLIEQNLSARKPGYGNLHDSLSPEEWIQSLREWAASHDPSIPPLSDEAISRESIYEGNPKWPI